MERYGLRGDYIYLLNDDILNFSDVISIGILIDTLKTEIIDFRYKKFVSESQNTHLDYLKGKKEYYEKLLFSMHKGLRLSMSASNYIDFKPIKDNFSLQRAFQGLLRIRKKSIGYIDCFSGDWVGNRWHLHESCSAEIKEKIGNTVSLYNENCDKFKEEIYSIDKIIALLLSDTYGETVLFEDLFTKYDLNINQDHIRDTYGQH